MQQNSIGFIRAYEKSSQKDAITRSSFTIVNGNIKIVQ